MRYYVSGVKYYYLMGWRMEDGTLQKTMLFDFFGDLLTEKQQEYFDLYHNEDLSLSEIAEGAGISKQGVYDIITRAEKSLTELECKTGIIKKWMETRAELQLAAANGESVHSAALRYFQLDKV